MEREFADLSPEERFAVRNEKSKPILDEYYDWLIQIRSRALPQGKLGKAVNYSFKHWDNLSTFLNDGEVEISNNDCENAVRPFAVGRNNWLFAKSVKGDQSSATVYTLIETAKLNGLSPFHYLEHVLQTMPNINTEDTNALDDLLPWSDLLPEEARLTPQKQFFYRYCPHPSVMHALVVMPLHHACTCHKARWRHLLSHVLPSPTLHMVKIADNE